MVEEKKIYLKELSNCGEKNNKSKKKVTGSFMFVHFCNFAIRVHNDHFLNMYRKYEFFFSFNLAYNILKN